MTRVSINATHDGQPLSVLSSLIAQRVKVLKESRRDAVTATAITALQSIRAATRRYNAKRGVKVTNTESAGEVSWRRYDGARTGFTRSGGVARRCFRSGGSRVEIGGSSKVVQLVAPGENWLAANIYQFFVPPALRERWPHQPESQIVVATTDKAMESYLRKRFGKIAERNGGAAQTALAMCAVKTSTRPQKMTAGGRNSTRTADKFTQVFKGEAGDTYTVSIVDSLSYAVAALKGGAGTIDTALKRAANRVAGYLRHRAAAPLRQKFATPFPEVAGRAS